ncbi:MAG: protein kinase domain-containing protein [Planctomycetota bacterium]
MKFRCPNCDHPILVGEASAHPLDQTDSLECPSCHSRIYLSSEETTTHISSLGLNIGQLELLQIVGEGAFGSVYQAWDKSLQRHVAVKVPRRDRVTADTAKAFLREARAAARVQHPNIVQVFEVGQTDNGIYIVSEFIGGITLSEWLRIHEPSWREAAGLMILICQGVHAAHEANVIHRDLKPGNILMDSKHQPHVSDFGLARNLSHEITVTCDGRIVGTPSYMSPEQASGRSEDVTRLADVWALGVMLYEMIVRKRPFAATDSQSVLFRILTEDPEAPRSVRPDIPEDLQTIILKALQKVPSDRYASAVEFGNDLQRLLDNKPIIARPTSRVRRLIKWGQRNRPLAVASAACGALSVLTVVLTITGALRNDESVVAYPVEIECSLNGDSVTPDQRIRWAVLPIDPETRIPVEDKIVRSDEALFEGNLVPGEYLFVVDAEGFGFHEVYRTIPDTPQTINSQVDHQSVTLLPGSTLKLPTIRILPSESVIAGMSRIPGGIFEMGDQEVSRQAHRREVESFWIDEKEVSVAQYRSFRKSSQPFLREPDQDPVASLTWFEAVAFAEFAGKRLLTESEFEFAATNRGTTEFPWGDDALSAGPWDYSTAGEPANDRMTDMPVFGLHSNVAEWTDSLLKPYPGMKPLPPGLVQHANLLSARVVRGGPVTAGPNDRRLNSWSETPKFRAAWNAATEDDEIGFRCGRSDKPRFLSR